MNYAKEHNIAFFDSYAGRYNVVGLDLAIKHLNPEPIDDVRGLSVQNNLGDKVKTIVMMGS